MVQKRFYVLLSRRGVQVYQQTFKDAVEHVAEDCGQAAFISCDVLDSDVTICTIISYLDRSVPTPLFRLGSHTVCNSQFRMKDWNTQARVAVWFFGPDKGWSSNEAAFHAAQIERVRAELCNPVE